MRSLLIKHMLFDSLLPRVPFSGCMVIVSNYNVNSQQSLTESTTRQQQQDHSKGNYTIKRPVKTRDLQNGILKPIKCRFILNIFFVFFFCFLSPRFIFGCFAFGLSIFKWRVLKDRKKTRRNKRDHSMSQ